MNQDLMVTPTAMLVLALEGKGNQRSRMPKPGRKLPQPLQVLKSGIFVMKQQR